MSVLSTLVKTLPSKGYFDLPLPGTLSVSGIDAEKFLQGQLTCNLDEISPTQSRLGAYCDIKGRVIAFFRLLQIGQEYHFITDPELIEPLRKTLKQYAAFSKVSLDTSPVFSRRIGIMGEGSSLQELIGKLESLSTQEPPIKSEQLSSALSHSTSQSASTLPKDPDAVISEEGFTIYAIPGSPTRWELLFHTGASFSLEEAHLEASPYWEAYNIISGIPTLKAATSGLLTPQKLGLDRLNALSFDKGCYLGQEIVARTHYLGSAKGGLFWASSASSLDFAPKSEIWDSQEQLVGHLLQCTPVEDKLTLLQAALKRAPIPEEQYFIDKTPLNLATPFTHELA